MEEKLLLEISEQMGEAVHNAWMEKRKKEKSWHGPVECPNYKIGQKSYRIDGSIRCWCPNCHPCMRPYSLLPESEKELDRKYPKLFFQILKDMGYSIVRIEMFDK